MLFKKKKVFDWKDLFRSVLYYFSELDEEKIKDISTISFAIALYTTFTFNKKFRMAESLGDVFHRSGTDGDTNEAIKFLNHEMHLYDFDCLENYFHNNCCSYWQAYLKKDAEKKTVKPLKKDKKLHAQWKAYAKYVAKRAVRCQKLINALNQNPKE